MNTQRVFWFAGINKNTCDLLGRSSRGCDQDGQGHQADYWGQAERKRLCHHLQDPRKDCDQLLYHRQGGWNHHHGRQEAQGFIPCFFIARFNMFSMSYQCLVNYFLLLVMRRQVYSVSLTPLFLPVMMICMFWSVCNVYCLLLSFPVHRQYGGWQNGLQDRQVLPHPGAQRRRDDWGTVNLTRTDCFTSMYHNLKYGNLYSLVPFQTLTMGSTTLIRKSKKM